MIALLAFASIIGVFLAGAYFQAHTIGAFILLGAAVVMLGVLFAAAETRGFEGQTLPAKWVPKKWGELIVAGAKVGVDRGAMIDSWPVYVQTPTGPLPITGVFTARINQTLSFVLDSTEVSHEAENILAGTAHP